jgi:hypothetical protein
MERNKESVVPWELGGKMHRKGEVTNCDHCC